MKFSELFKKNKVTAEEIHDYIDNWHKSDSKESLHDFLGMTVNEYSEWVSNKKYLADILLGESNA